MISDNNEIYEYKKETEEERKKRLAEYLKDLVEKFKIDNPLTDEDMK